MLFRKAILLRSPSLASVLGDFLGRSYLQINSLPLGILWRGCVCLLALWVEIPKCPLWLENVFSNDGSPTPIIWRLTILPLYLRKRSLVNIVKAGTTSRGFHHIMSEVMHALAAMLLERHAPWQPHTYPPSGRPE